MTRPTSPQDRPNIPYDLAEPLVMFWKRRLDSHTFDWYRGRRLCKMPEDLRTYQHLLEESVPDVVLELGSYDGGSAIWFADQLDIFNPNARLSGDPTVISVDMNHINYDDTRIEFIQGRIDDPTLVELIRPFLEGKRVFISEDSGHNYVTTSSALKFYADFVSKGSWFVVEDGVVDIEPVKLPRYGGGVLPAIKDFLSTDQGSRFSQHWLQPYGLTTDFGGWLKAER